MIAATTMIQTRPCTTQSQSDGLELGWPGQQLHQRWRRASSRWIAGPQSHAACLTGSIAIARSRAS